jgi:hypothetical protein
MAGIAKTIGDDRNQRQHAPAVEPAMVRERAGAYDLRPAGDASELARMRRETLASGRSRDVISAMTDVTSEFPELIEPVIDQLRNARR